MCAVSELANWISRFTTSSFHFKTVLDTVGRRELGLHIDTHDVLVVGSTPSLRRLTDIIIVIIILRQVAAVGWQVTSVFRRSGFRSQPLLFI
jgi:hypothetical protein